MGTVERNIYLLYSCDEWKSFDSMTLIMATSGKMRMRKEIKRQLRNKDMNFDCSCLLIDLEMDEINTQLEYGMLLIITDGERQ